ncbi:MAG TPA: DUF1801 domain-containing protein [Gemmatimonadales bacterium]|jgi:hypothetical protein
MAELKTKAKSESVAAFLAKVDVAVRDDAREVVALIERVTGADARVWGSGLIGAGDYHYKYDSGREGDWFELGFAPRKGKLTFYLSSLVDGRADILKRLGKHKASGGCVHVARLAEIDRAVLQEALTGHVRQLRAHIATKRADETAKRTAKAAAKPAKAGKTAAKPKSAVRNPAAASAKRKSAARKKAAR